MMGGPAPPGLLDKVLTDPFENKPTPAHDATLGVGSFTGQPRQAGLLTIRG